jgi:heat shock protein HslJ
MKQFAALTLLSIMLSSFATAEESTKLLTGTNWKMRPVGSTMRDDVVKVIFGRDGTYRVKGGGCRGIFGAYSEVGEKLNFIGLGSTRNICPDSVSEPIAWKIAGNTRSFKIQKNMLVLFDEAGAEIFAVKRQK